MPNASAPQDPVVHTVTTVGESARDDSETRLKRYLLTMGFRTACFVLAIVLHGWPRWIAVFFAVVLPWIAVMLANAARPRIPGEIEPVDRPERHLTR